MTFIDICWNVIQSCGLLLVLSFIIALSSGIFKCEKKIDEIMGWAAGSTVVVGILAALGLVWLY